VAIDYLELTNGYSEDGKFELRGRTRGCGCCAGDIHADNKEQALAKLKDWEDETVATLANIKALRKAVKKDMK
jgi:hypothetical protein